MVLNYWRFKPEFQANSDLKYRILRIFEALITEATFKFEYLGANLKIEF